MPGKDEIRTITWKGSKECFWSELDFLRSNAGLSTQFHKCKKLFRHILGISKLATFEHIVNDLQYLASFGSPDLISNSVKPALFRLSILVSRAKEDRPIVGRSVPSMDAQKLQNLKIWPVKHSEAKSFEVVSSRDFSSGNFLFVPDRVDLYELFRDKVPLLDFSPVEIAKIQPLLDWFPDARLLSVEIQEKLSYSANPVFHRIMTSDFREKHDSILRCVGYDRHRP